MKSYRYTLLIVIFAFLPLFMLSQTVYKNCSDGKVYFKFKDNIDPAFTAGPENQVDPETLPFLSAMKDAYGVTALSRPFYLNNDPKLLRTLQVDFSKIERVDELISRLAENPDIEYAEKVPYDVIDYVPDDTLYNLYNGPTNWNWHLDRIMAEQAWDINKGSASVKVAIVDNAIWSGHPDLASKIILQRDVVHNNNNSSPPNSGDPFAWSHGTHCAGLAAGATDNHTGIASIGYDVSIIAVKASSNTQPDNISGGFTGMQWAASNGAKVISCSWGNNQYSATNQNIINTIYNMGVVILAAAGNDNSTGAHYPSGYNHVISVASTNSDDKKTDFSNYGTTVDICAPGGYCSPGPQGLLSTTFSTGTYGNYDLMYGTSMATPVAAGLAGLILSVNAALTPAQVEEVMKNSADDIYPVNPDYTDQLGAGRINAYKAVISTPFAPTAAFSTPVTIITPNTHINFTDLSTGVPSTWLWTFEGASNSSSGAQNPAGVYYQVPGIYDVTLKVTNSFGTSTLTLPDYITVTNSPLPYIGFSASNYAPCIMETVSFTDSTLYEPLTWEWSFQPSTVNYVNGTSAFSQNPQVEFQAPGSYDVTLYCTNQSGGKSVSFPGMIAVDGAMGSFSEDMESGNSGHFILRDTAKSQSSVDAIAANQSLYGIHLHGDPTPTGWKGGATTTTASQAWEENLNFQSEAAVCGLDAMGYPNVYLYLDLKQTYSLGAKFCWFRVLVNGEQAADINGMRDFNPATQESDPFSRLKFDLSPFAGGVMEIRLQAATRFSYGSSGGADNVFLDNIQLVCVDATSAKEGSPLVPVLSALPNPSDGLFTIHISNLEGNARLFVYSLQGKLVHCEDITIPSPGLPLALDLGHLPPGTYQLVVETGNVSVSRVLIRK